MLTCEIRLVQTAIHCVTCDRWATRGYTAADQPEWGKSITVRADECTYLGQSSSYTAHKRCIRYKVSVWVTKKHTHISTNKLDRKKWCRNENALIITGFRCLTFVYLKLYCPTHYDPCVFFIWISIWSE